jgi:hypothetical protein
MMLGVVALRDLFRDQANPVEIVSGRLTPMDLSNGIIAMMLWRAFFIVLYRWLWRQATLLKKSSAFLVRAKSPTCQRKKQPRISDQRQRGKRCRCDPQTANGNVLESIHRPSDRGKMPDGLKSLARYFQRNPRAAQR